MKKLIPIFIFMASIQVNVCCQILIGNQNGNIIYSSVKNQIKYIGKHNCQEISARIEGYNKLLTFENCLFEITYLKFDTTKIEIINKADEVIFDTILIKNSNAPKAYLQIGNKLLTEGSMHKDELPLLDQLRVQYACPWMKAPKIYGFHLTVINEAGEYLSYKIQGNQIPQPQKMAIAAMKAPKRLYIEQIKWVPVSCFETIASIVLDITE